MEIKIELAPITYQARTLFNLKSNNFFTSTNYIYAVSNGTMLAIISEVETVDCCWRAWAVGTGKIGTAAAAVDPWERMAGRIGRRVAGILDCTASWATRVVAAAD